MGSVHSMGPFLARVLEPLLLCANVPSHGMDAARPAAPPLMHPDFFLCTAPHYTNRQLINKALGLLDCNFLLFMIQKEHLIYLLCFLFVLFPSFSVSSVFRFRLPLFTKIEFLLKVVVLVLSFILVPRPLRIAFE